MRVTNEKGITLIALIITIIIMLILVGVTVNVALNGGLFSKAKEAVAETDEARIQEEMQGAILSALDSNGNIDLNKLKQEIEKIKGIEKVEGTSFPLTVKDKNGNEWAIDSNGTIESVEPEVEKIVAESDEEYSYWKTDGQGTIIYYEVPEGKEVPETLIVPSQIGDEKITTIGLGALTGLEYPRKEDGAIDMEGEINIETDENGNPIPTGQTTKIKSIIISKGIETIEVSAISYCTSLKNLTISSTVSTLGEYWCESNTQLENLVILGGVTSIDFVSTNFGENLKTVDIRSASDLVIGSYAFEDHTALEKVNLKGSSITIGGSAFLNCTNLKTVNISDGLKTLGSGCFSECTSIKEIYIPDSVENIKSGAFDGWTNEQTIYMGLSKEPTLVDIGSDSGWLSNWKYGCNAKIVWGAKR